MGRFLSVDPLTQSYPMLTPYQFASNTPIQAIDLDGLEAAYVTKGYGAEAHFNRHPASNEQTFKAVIGLSIPLIIVADIMTTKGQLTKLAFQSMGTQVTVNTGIEMANYLVFDENVSFERILKESYNETDIVDLFFGKISFKKYGKLVESAIRVGLTSFVDLTPDEFSTLGFGKNVEDVTYDMVFGALLEKCASGAPKGRLGRLARKVLKAADNIIDAELRTKIDTNNREYIDKISDDYSQELKIDNTRVVLPIIEEESGSNE